MVFESVVSVDGVEEGDIVFVEGCKELCKSGVYVTSEFVVFAKSVCAIVFDSFCGPFVGAITVLDVKVVEGILAVVIGEVQLFGSKVCGE